MDKIVLLLVLSLFCLSSHAQDIRGDTVACYNRNELKKIAEDEAFATLCDSLLILTQLQVDNRDSVIGYRNQQLYSKGVIIQSKDTLISNKNHEIERLTTTLTKTQVYWYVTVGLLILSLLKK